MDKNCKEIKENYKNNVFQNNLDNLNELVQKLGETKISKYILGDNLKIVGILLKNNLFLPIIPSGVSEKYLNNIETISYIKSKLITINKFIELVGEEVKI